MKTFFKNFAFILGILSTSCFGMEYKAQDFFSGKLDVYQLEKLAQEKEKEIIAIINSPKFDVNQKIIFCGNKRSTFYIAGHSGTPPILEALLKKAKPSKIDRATIVSAFHSLYSENFLMLLKYKVNPLEILKVGASNQLYSILLGQVYTPETFERLKIRMDAIMQVCPEFLITPDTHDKMNCWQAAQKLKKELLKKYRNERTDPDLAKRARSHLNDLHYINSFIEYLKNEYIKHHYAFRFKAEEEKFLKKIS